MRNKILLPIAFLLLSIISMNAATKAAADQPTETMTLITGKAIERCTPWTTAELSGKLRLSKLPISPSVKIYMKRNQDVILSARAPFLGEVLRVELTGDTLTAINKMKKTYAVTSSAGVQELDTAFCADVQGLLLGRVVVPGYGELSEENVVNTIRELDGEDLLMSPSSDPDASINDVTAAMRLIYRISTEGVLTQTAVVKNGSKLLCLLDMDEDTKGSRSIDVTVNLKTPLTFRLDLEAPKWNVTLPQSMKIDSKYRKIPFSEFLKSF